MHSKTLLVLALAAVASAQDISLPSEKPNTPLFSGAKLFTLPTASTGKFTNFPPVSIPASEATGRPFTIQTSTGPLRSQASSDGGSPTLSGSSDQAPAPTGSAGESDVPSDVPSGSAGSIGIPPEITGSTPPATASNEPSETGSAPATATGSGSASGSGSGSPSASASATGNSGSKNGAAAMGVILAAGLVAVGIAL